MSLRDLQIPDFLYKDGFELASKVLRLNFALQILSCQNSFLGIFDVMSLFAVNQSLEKHFFFKSIKNETLIIFKVVMSLRSLLKQEVMSFTFEFNLTKTCNKNVI